MKMGHHFNPQHGFTGSANPTEEFRPTVPGFKRGGNVPSEETAEEAGECFKHGGLSHMKSHHKNYAHGHHGDHDNHPKNGKVVYDKHGFEKHTGRSHKSMKDED